MKLKFSNLGMLLTRKEAKSVIGGYSDGGQCWVYCENEYHTNCLNNEYNGNGHYTDENCLQVSSAHQYCIKKCGTPEQPVNQ
jgi:hypothetical protein